MGLVALKLLSSGEPEYRAPRLTSVVHRRHRRGLFLFRHFGDEGLGSDEERGDRGRVLQRGTHDLGRVDHTGLAEILVLAGRCVEAPVVVVALEQLRSEARRVGKAWVSKGSSRWSPYIS